MLPHTLAISLKGKRDCLKNSLFSLPYGKLCAHLLPYICDPADTACQKCQQHHDKILFVHFLLLHFHYSHLFTIYAARLSPLALKEYILHLPSFLHCTMSASSKIFKWCDSVGCEIWSASIKSQAFVAPVESINTILTRLSSERALHTLEKATAFLTSAARSCLVFLFM